MIEDQALLDAINKSPLSDEDKDHWHSLLPKLTSEQRERLYHSLTAKTEISRAIKLIKKALEIIAEAEAEAEQEVHEEEEKKKEKEELLQELEEIKEKEEEILFDEKALKQRQMETQAEIEKIRAELKALSMEVHGQPPPSYQPPQQQGAP